MIRVILSNFTTRYVPLFFHLWNEIILYQPDEEIAYIESMIKPME